MPIDKFGRHMLRKRIIPYSSSTSSFPILTSPPGTSPFYICEPSLHHSKCIINIRGHLQKSKSLSLYTLENTTTVYKFPVFGKIESIEVSPIDTTVFFNKTEVIIEKLVGNIINIGDQLIFYARNKDPLYVQIVLQCPITKDD